MRLLLDEHYSPEIARQLRTRGHDVVAVAERADLVGLGDDELLGRMARERRASMTNNVKDFLPLVGRFVEALDAFLRRHQGDDACRNQVQWLGGSAAVDGATPPAPIRRAGAGE